MQKKNTILLVDGNLLMFKSFYAWMYSGQPAYESKSGINTNGIHIFFVTLFKALDQFKATHCFVAFDYGAKTKRHDIFPDYKAGRTKAPQDLFVQMNEVKLLLNLMGIKVMDKKLIEGDDLIASFSKQLKTNPDNKILIFSSDQDLLQLVDEQISIIHKHKGVPKYDLKTNQNFFDYHGFYPHQVIEYKGLSGDPADNLPGVAGIGPKTAKTLLENYGTLENIYANLEKLKPGVQTKLVQAQKMAFLCREIATLNYDVELGLSIADIVLNWELTPELKEKLDQLELNQIQSKFEAKSETNRNNR